MTSEFNCWGVDRGTRGHRANLAPCRYFIRKMAAEKNANAQVTVCMHGETWPLDRGRPGLGLGFASLSPEWPMLPANARVQGPVTPSECRCSGMYPSLGALRKSTISRRLGQQWRTSPASRSLRGPGPDSEPQQRLSARSHPRRAGGCPCMDQCFDASVRQLSERGLVLSLLPPRKTGPARAAPLQAPVNLRSAHFCGLV